MRFNILNLLFIPSLALTSMVALASHRGGDFDFEDPEEEEVGRFAGHERAGRHSPRPNGYPVAAPPFLDGGYTLFPLAAARTRPPVEEVLDDDDASSNGSDEGQGNGGSFNLLLEETPAQESFIQPFLQALLDQHGLALVDHLAAFQRVPLIVHVLGFEGDEADDVLRSVLGGTGVFEDDAADAAPAMQAVFELHTLLPTIFEWVPPKLIEWDAPPIGCFQMQKTTYISLPSPYADLQLDIMPTYYGDGWYARQMLSSDWQSLARVFMNPHTVRHFWTGQPWDAEFLERNITQKALENFLPDDQKPRISYVIGTRDGLIGEMEMWLQQSQRDETNKIVEWSPTTEASVVFLMEPAALPQAAEVGLVSPQFLPRSFLEKRSIAEQAVRWMMGQAPRVASHVQYYATVRRDNPFSEAVLRRLGMQPDPARQGLELYGAQRDHYVIPVDAARK